MLRPLLLVGTAVLALAAPAGARAQGGRHFIDSWFFGAKGGLMTFWTSQVKHAPAPLVGIETMITRKKAALYLSAEEAIFTENATFPVYDKDPEDEASFTGTGVQLVGIGTARMSNMRRYQASLYAFPFERSVIRPYLGVGLAINEVRHANITAVEQVVDSLPEPCCAVFASLERARSVTSMVYTAGVQMQLARASIFGQATIMPEHSAFLMDRRAPFTIEAGFRYNIGRARETK